MLRCLSVGTVLVLLKRRLSSLTFVAEAQAVTDTNIGTVTYSLSGICSILSIICIRMLWGEGLPSPTSPELGEELLKKPTQKYETPFHREILLLTTCLLSLLLLPLSLTLPLSSFTFSGYESFFLLSDEKKITVNALNLGINLYKDTTNNLFYKWMCSGLFFIGVFGCPAVSLLAAINLQYGQR